MRKHITHLVALAALLLLGAANTTSSQTFTPSPADGPRAVLTTTKAVGDTIAIQVQSNSDNIWIDLNDNASYDEGELVQNNFEHIQKFVLQKQNVAVYGDLIAFSCFEDRLTNLDVSKLTQLTRLICFQNQLTNLDLSNQTSLKELMCSENQLASLDLSKNVDLELLFCSINPIKSLDVSMLTKLTELYCYQNQITSLDLSNLTNLTRVWCFQNQLTSLDVANLTKLIILACQENQIKEAEMQKIVDALPEVVTGEAIFFPYNPRMEANAQNQCTPKQVNIAVGKGWKVLDPDGEPFAGVAGLEDISASQKSILLLPKEGMLFISGLEDGMPVVIYTIDGTNLYSGKATGTEMGIPLSAGNYVLRIGNYSAKTLIP